MSLSPDTLRIEAARFRRLKRSVTDPQTLRTIDHYADELEARAKALENSEAKPE
jgi:hypothetical protein